MLYWTCPVMIADLRHYTTWKQKNLCEICTWQVYELCYELAKFNVLQLSARSSNLGHTPVNNNLWGPMDTAEKYSHTQAPSHLLEARMGMALITWPVTCLFSHQWSNAPSYIHSSSLRTPIATVITHALKTASVPDTAWHSLAIHHAPILHTLKSAVIFHSMIRKRRYVCIHTTDARVIEGIVMDLQSSS